MQYQLMTTDKNVTRSKMLYDYFWRKKQINGWMDGWMDGWKDGWLDAWIKLSADEQMWMER